ncbi:MAG: hypothetical protein HZB39_06480 [Planctomycetes bacterium]|nr:hypothetical protein [Planctomycetota bacterium]
MLSLSTPGGDADPETTVTSAIAVGHNNAVAATVVVMALTAGSINVALSGSDDSRNWISLGSLPEVSSIGTTMGQISSVATSLVRALVTLSSVEGAAQCTVALRLHLTSL